MTITDLTLPEYPGPGIGITDTCGLCRQTFDLMAPADQYPTLTNDMGDPEELICDGCQDLMEAGQGETKCAFCATSIILIDGEWWADDGTLACTDTSAPYVPHKPATA